MDTYRTLTELTAAEPPDAWRVVAREGRRSGLQVAIHAGGIEAGSGEVAWAVAQRTGMAAYLFEGLLPADNRRLHVTSTTFDEPTLRALLHRPGPVYSWHGYGDDRVLTLVGGRDTSRGQLLLDALRDGGFEAHAAADLEPALAGRSARNVANRGAGGAGVQIEIAAGQRRRFFEPERCRHGGAMSAEFHRFVDAAVEACSLG